MQLIEPAVQVIAVDLGGKYDPTTNDKQMEFHAAEEKYKLFGGAMGGGKTAALINEGIQLNIDFPGNFGLLLRKTWPSFRDTVLPQLEKFLDIGLVSDWNHTDKIITFPSNSKLRYGGQGDRPDDWEKWMSGEYGWIALDQAEQFTETEFRMLSTRLRLKLPGIKYYFLLSCNPNVGWIKERFIERNLKKHIFIPSLPTDNLANLPEDYIEDMRDMLTPQQIKALLEGNWEAVGEPDNVYAYKAIQKAKQNRAPREEPVELGVDVARYGDDESVIILREGLHIGVYSRAQGHDTMRTTGLIWKCIQDEVLPRWKDKLNKIAIKIDADGIGGSCVDRANELRAEKETLYTDMILKMVSDERREALIKENYKFRIKIVEIHGSSKARQPAQFRNLRAEIHWALRELLVDLDIPSDREIATQLMSIKYFTNSAGQTEIVSKKRIKHKLGRSPDLAEAIIYSLAHIAPGKEYAIWRP